MNDSCTPYHADTHRGGLAEALAKLGLVIVPIEPTRYMESVGASYALGGTATHAALCWEAMVEAAMEEDSDAN